MTRAAHDFPSPLGLMRIGLIPFSGERSLHSTLESAARSLIFGLSA